MIAPLRPSQTENAERRQRFQHAHHWVAMTLLPNPSASTPTAQQISAWKAWLFLAWVASTMAVYAGSMLGIWQ